MSYSVSQPTSSAPFAQPAILTTAGGMGYGGMGSSLFGGMGGYGNFSADETRMNEDNLKYNEDVAHHKDQISSPINRNNFSDQGLNLVFPAVIGAGLGLAAGAMNEKSIENKFRAQFEAPVKPNKADYGNEAYQSKLAEYKAAMEEYKMKAPVMPVEPKTDDKDAKDKYTEEMKTYEENKPVMPNRADYSNDAYKSKLAEHKQYNKAVNEHVANEKMCGKVGGAGLGALVGGGIALFLGMKNGNNNANNH